MYHGHLYLFDRKKQQLDMLHCIDFNLSFYVVVWCGAFKLFLILDAPYVIVHRYVPA